MSAHNSTSNIACWMKAKAEHLSGWTPTFMNLIKNVPLQRFVTRSLPVFALLALSVFLAGCDASDEPVSTDLEFIRRQIDLNIPAPAGKWEIFRTPENTRAALPGPSDYETLIVEFQEVAPSWSAHLPAPASQLQVVPGVVRPWLSSRSKALLQRADAGRIKLTATDNCHGHSARVRTSGRIVEGFVCAQGNKVLLYLTLAQPKTGPVQPAPQARRAIEVPVGAQA